MNVLQRIEDNLASNKSSTKTYATHSKAAEVGKRLGAQFNEWNGSSIDVDFIVVYVPSVARYTPVFNLTKWLRAYNNGTFLGWFAHKGFFSI
jgi:hypothetical protein